MSPWRQEISPAEEGFALIEVLVSAAVVVLVSAGTFGLLQAMTRASAEQRHGSQAFAVAQEDQARLRSMQLVALSNLSESREIKLAGTTFTVRSTGVFINNKTAALSCDGENISADYAQVTSVVTWPGAASSERAVLRSLVSPTINSINSQNGTLTVQVTNEKKEPKAGIDLKAGVYSAETDANGCATFPDLPSGTVTLKSYGEDRNLVTPNSVYVQETTAGVGAGAAKVAKLTYDSPGTVPVKFKYRVGSKAEYKPAFVDSVVAFHSVMKEARTLGDPGGPRLEKVDAYPLFPFTSPYTLYPGSCSANDPGAGSGQGSAIVPAGKTSGELELQVPALEVTVKEGSKVIKGAKVTITDKTCKDLKGSLVKRIYTTNSEGKQFTLGSPTEATEPAIPWGTYEVCASAKVSSGSIRKRTASTVAVQSLTNTTLATIDLSTGTSSGECL
jgi:type II secretory pathway pseudopilin PulG